MDSLKVVLILLTIINISTSIMNSNEDINNMMRIMKNLEQLDQHILMDSMGKMILEKNNLFGLILKQCLNYGLLRKKYLKYLSNLVNKSLKLFLLLNNSNLEAYLECLL